MALKAVLFDFNGVLVDDEPLHWRMYNVALRPHNIHVSKADYYEKYLGFDDRDAFRAILKDQRRKPAPGLIERLVATKAAAYARKMPNVPFFHGAARLVRQAARRYPLGVVTGAIRAEAEGLLTREGLRSCFKAVVAAEDVKRGKPDPEGYRKGLHALRAASRRPLKPSEVLVIEDGPAGIEAAKRAGMGVLAVAHTYPPRELRAADALSASIRNLRVEEMEALFR
ncbi:MAG: HAD family phosphatase [Halobacteria archaeon]